MLKRVEGYMTYLELVSHAFKIEDRELKRRIQPMRTKLIKIKIIWLVEF